MWFILIQILNNKIFFHISYTFEKCNTDDAYNKDIDKKISPPYAIFTQIDFKKQFT